MAISRPGSARWVRAHRRMVIAGCLAAPRRDSGDADRIALHVRTGTIANPAMRASVTQVLSRVDRLPHVSGVVSPPHARARPTSRPTRPPHLRARGPHLLLVRDAYL